MCKMAQHTENLCVSYSDNTLYCLRTRQIPLYVQHMYISTKHALVFILFVIVCVCVCEMHMCEDRCLGVRRGHYGSGSSLSCTFWSMRAALSDAVNRALVLHKNPPEPRALASLFLLVVCTQGLYTMDTQD